MRFDGIEIDRERFEVRRDGAQIPIEPKVFDLVCHLIDNANRLVTKDDLIERVWQGRIVSDSALSTAVKSARKALGDAGQRISTVRGRGFRFDLPEDANNTSPTAAPTPVFSLPNFAVLPPKGVGDRSDHIARALTRAMSRIPFLNIVSHGAILGLEDVSPKGVRAAFGPGFVLEVLGTGEASLEVTLVDTATHGALWSQRVSEDTLDACLMSLAARLQPQLVRAIQASLSGQPKADAKALTMEGLGSLSLRGWNPLGFREAESKLADAIGLDDTLAVAHAALALVLALGPRIGMTEPTTDRRAQAISHADRAMDLDDMSPVILGLAGCALCDAGQGTRGQSVLERALSLDGDNPQALAALGAHLLTEKDVAQSVELLQRAVATVPQDNVLAIWSSALALALLKSGQPEAAQEAARRAVAADDRSHFPKITAATVALALGQQQAAAAAFEDAFRVTPDLNWDRVAAAVGQTAADALFAQRNAPAT